MARIAAQPKISDLIAAGEIAPAKQPTERPGLPAIPTQDPGHAVHFRGPLADDQWTSGDAARQWYGKNVPQSRITPPQPAQSANLNATIQSTAAPQIAAAIAAIPPSTGSGILSLSYTGNEFTIGSPNGPNTTITKNPQPPHTFWAAPIAGLSDFLGFTGNNYSTGTGGSPVATNPTITFTPQQIPSWVYYFQESAGNTNTAPSGWTTLLDAATLQMSSTSPVTATDPTAPAFTWCNVAIQFAGTVPAVVASSAVNIPQPANTVSHTFSSTAGDVILVAIRGINGGANGAIVPLNVSDSQGNAYSLIGFSIAGNSGFNGSGEVAVFATGNIPGGAVTVTASTGALVGGGGGFRANFVEFGPLNSGPGVPSFRSIASSDLPAIPASLIIGVLGVKEGGTGSDLSATGGTSQFLRQSSTGGAIIPIQLDYPDLAGQSIAALYDNVTLAGKGLPSIVFQNSTTSLGNITSINVGTLNTGLYRVSVTLIAIVGTIGIGDVIPECDFTFNDPLLASNTILMTPVTAYISSTTTYATQSVILSITSSSPAHFSTTGYAGTGTYRIVTQVEQV